MIADAFPNRKLTKCGISLQIGQGIATGQTRASFILVIFHHVRLYQLDFRSRVTCASSCSAALLPASRSCVYMQPAEWRDLLKHLQVK